MIFQIRNAEALYQNLYEDHIIEAEKKNLVLRCPGFSIPLSEILNILVLGLPYYPEKTTITPVEGSVDLDMYPTVSVFIEYKHYFLVIPFFEKDNARKFRKELLECMKAIHLNSFFDVIEVRKILESE